MMITEQKYELLNINCMLLNIATIRQPYQPYIIINNIFQYWFVPENTHTLLMEDYWKFQGLGGGRVPKIFTEKCEPKMEFSEGRRGSNRKPSMGGGDMDIVWNNSLRRVKMYKLPVWNMRRNSISKGLKYREVFNEDSGNKDNVILSLLFKLSFTQ
jgi:hypothetical protein